MSMDAVFVQDGDRFTATDLALGPWAPGALHGGAPAALLVHAINEHAGPDAALRPARITYEFVRPVPMGPLTVEVAVVRPGRRVTLLDGLLRDPDGTEVTRARALLLLPAELGDTAWEPPPFPGPEKAERNDWQSPEHGRMFATDAMEIRFVRGRFREPGDAIAWFRLRHPLVAGRPTAPLERIAAAADFGNGIASVLSWDEHVFINPDLTLHVEREPVDEWVALESVMRVGPGRIALAESVIWDRRGRIGRAVQSLLVGSRE
ncbi:MAG TPA: thioesterase family protein [Solirubrobacteraceae bacterium]|jgi:acyl-coenzyme A thioesterase PaaI-like protein|nr:thioesterase family protein [Solirubrobacteraceae bacterium]